MQINKNCKLFLRDIYSYDISACHYNILVNLGFDVSDLNKENKEERNIKIGKMMRNNPRLTDILRSTTESMITEYLFINNIKDDDLVIRQYDGVLTTKKLKNDTTSFLPLELRSIFKIFIISINRDRYIALDEKNEIIIKGVPHRYGEIDNIFKDILSINYLNKSSIFKSLKDIKNKILTSSNPFLYAIPTNDKDKFNILFKKYGQLEVSKSVLSIMDIDDIDKEKYFEIYMRPFSESLVVEFA